MTRALGVGITADIAAATGERCQLIQLDFADLSNVSTPVYLTTAAKSITWNGFTFQGTGHTLEIDPLGESAEDPGNGIRVKLSGVDQTIAALILGSNWRGRLATIWYTGLDQGTGALKTDPVLMFQGPMNGGFSWNESRGDFGGGTVDITGSFTTRLDELVKVRGVRCNRASHQSLVPGASTDTFFQNVDSLQQRRVFWGVKTPQEPYHGGGTQGGVSGNGGLTNPGGAGTGTIGGSTPGSTGGGVTPPASNPGSIGGSTPGGSGGIGGGLTNPGTKPSIGWGGT